MEWAAIIGTLVNAFLARCQQQNNPEQTPAQAQAELRKEYEAAGEMPPAKVRQVMPQVLKAERKARRENLTTQQERKSKPMMTRPERYAMAEQKLIEAMNADKPAVKSAFKSAASLGDDY